MDILLLGNGFDLAHNLPTKYTDFLEWINCEYQLYVDLKDKKDEIMEKMPELEFANTEYNCSSKLSVEKLKDDDLQIEIWSCMHDNDWIEYFFQCDMHGNENWIDFESEMAEVVKGLENNIVEYDIYKKIISLTNSYLNDKYTNNTAEYISALSREEQEAIEKETVSFKYLRDKLISDLERLIRLLEIYLVEYVRNRVIDVISPDIKRITVDKVISFNYTDTYERLYGTRNNIDYDYIHGKANINNVLKTNNMVLGIDEHRSDEIKNERVEFICFRKFYQRILKTTGNKCREWIDEIAHDCLLCEGAGKYALQQTLLGKKNYSAVTSRIHRLYIWGHSLDVTDKDVLKNLILNDNVYTTIFYYEEDNDNGRTDLGKKIANLVKVIGQDELIKRTGGSTKTIEFKLQQKMIGRTL